MVGASDAREPSALYLRVLVMLSGLHEDAVVLGPLE